ncbi:unnamed protein product [Periconia digitata]|uniref:Uncharacterized protein n=1 Tax=Periconia digitata TaxID=1303443 RepID=A0A9W4U324_9PLEO|nr:unnamed protein product [Periconia digitata]
MKSSQQPRRRHDAFALDVIVSLLFIGFNAESGDNSHSTELRRNSRPFWNYRLSFTVGHNGIDSTVGTIDLSGISDCHVLPEPSATLGFTECYIFRSLYSTTYFLAGHRASMPSTAPWPQGLQTFNCHY